MAQQRGRFTNQYQHRHLRERLDSALRRKEWALREEKKPPVPVAMKKVALEIKRLNKIVKAYDDAAYKAERAKRDALQSRHTKAMERILFSTPDEALRLVKEFEAS